MNQKYIVPLAAFVLGIALAFSIAGYVNSVNTVTDHHDGLGCPMMSGDHGQMHDMMESSLGEDHFDDNHHQEMHNNMMGAS